MCRIDLSDLEENAKNLCAVKLSPDERNLYSTMHYLVIGVGDGLGLTGNVQRQWSDGSEIALLE